MSQNVNIEWAPFTLAKGVDEARLLAASDALQIDFLVKQPGFIRRELLKGQDGQWVDLVVWENRDAANQAVKNAANSAVCFEYFQLMAGADHHDPGSGVLHLDRIKTYERQANERVGTVTGRASRRSMRSVAHSPDSGRKSL